MTANLAIIEQMYAGVPQPLGSGGAFSAIHKSSVVGPWRITSTGLLGDEQADLRNHGGPEKALHHYTRDHYATWSAEMPEISHLLDAPPAFGENISTQGLTEADICLGDTMRLGTVVLQVSQGRQPCWKLNARFGVADMAMRVQRSGRSGWYYRVLDEGSVEPGDTLRLIERPHPEWPLARAISVLYKRTLAFDELAELAAVPTLAESWRRLMQRRLQTGKVESWGKRLTGSRIPDLPVLISSANPSGRRIARRRKGKTT